MSKRWSKLQSRLYNIIDENLDFQIHMAVYPMNANDSHHGKARMLPRYWITIGKEIVFDYPKEFDTTYKYGVNSYPWDSDIEEITNIIEEYIQAPKETIMNSFENDRWGITDILRACDKRLGKHRLKDLYGKDCSNTVKKIIEQRLVASD